MKIRQTTLPNGLRIVTAQMPGARSATALVMAGAGSRHETTENNGVSHWLEHLLFKGSERYSGVGVIDGLIESAGGLSYAYTTEEVTGYYIKVPATSLEMAVDILCDMVTAPLFDPAEVNRERGPVIEELRLCEDEPERAVGLMLPGMMFPGHPLGRTVIGPEVNILNMTTAQLRAYHEQQYHPANLVVSVAGRVKHAEVVRQVKRLLGGLKPQPMVAKQPVTTAPAKQLVCLKPKRTSQAHMLVVSRSYGQNDPREPQAEVLAAILGHGASCRLYVNIREHQGLAYKVEANLDTVSDTGVFYAYAGANLDNADQALALLMSELERIRRQVVEPAELVKAQRQLVAQLEMDEEENSNVAELLATQLIVRGQLISLDNRIAAIRAVTSQDVQRAAQDLLRPDQLRLIVVAPGVTAKQLGETFRRLVA